MSKLARHEWQHLIDGSWTLCSLMYLFTSDTVHPIGKLECLWRLLAGPFNFLPI